MKCASVCVSRVKSNSDVVVVGGGPCGSFTALNLAKKSIDVTVLEEHSEIGVPSHCAGHVSIKGLRDLGLYPLPKDIVENIFNGATFHSPFGKQFSVRFSTPVTCVVNRSLFDKHITRMAEAFGAKYCLDSRVDSLIIKNGHVHGVTIKQEENVVERTSKIVVDAEGVSSRLLKQTKLTCLDRRMLFNGVEVEVDNVKDVDLDSVEVFLGRDYAPGFFAWLIPKPDGFAKAGLVTKTGNPKELLQRLMIKHPVASKKLGRARILQTAFHPVTLGGLIQRMHSHGFLAVGDVASQVKPTTGGGVVLGMNCAKIAADVVAEALNAGDFSEEILSNYQARVGEFLDFDMHVMLGIRKALDRLPDKKLDDAVNLCAKLGLDKVFRNVSDTDLQGRSLLCTLGNPRMLAVLGYFVRLYLSTLSGSNCAN